MASIPPKRFLFRTEVNSFHYLYQDAEYLLSACRLPNIRNSFEVTRIARSAFLLYALSLEALINRVLDQFLKDDVRDFITDREEKFSTIDKWQILSLLTVAKKLDLGAYPWSHLNELFKIRNDYVHPKHDRKAYYEALTKTKMKHVDWKDIPKDSGLAETDFIYRQTRLPKDPYGFGLAQLEGVKKIVDDAVKGLDNIMGGKILANNWAIGDQLTLFFPPGAILDDIPSDVP